MEYNLPKVGGVSWEKAYHYMPDKALLLEVLKEFVKSASQQVDLLKGMKEDVEREPNEDHFASFRIQAHAMKANLRSLGADLFDPALELEEAGRDGDRDTILTKTESFLAAYLALAEKLQAVVGDCKTEKAFESDNFYEAVSTVKAAMDAFDIPVLQLAFKTMQEMELPDQYRREVKLMEPAVRDLDADRVLEICDRLEAMKS